MTLTVGGLVVAVVVAVLTAVGIAFGAVRYLSGRIDRLAEANEAAHAGIVARVDGLSGRVDGLARDVAGVVARVDGLSGRVDGLARDVAGIGRDVSFLAGRQAERDRRDGRDPPAPRGAQG